jgi:hypothetical protein
VGTIEMFLLFVRESVKARRNTRQQHTAEVYALEGLSARYKRRKASTGTLYIRAATQPTPAAPGRIPS